MTQRLNYMQQSPELFKKFLEFSMHIKDKSSIETDGERIVRVRAQRNPDKLVHLAAALAS